MKNLKYIVLLFTLLISTVAFADTGFMDTVKSFITWDNVVTFMFGAMSLLFGSFLILAKDKIRKAGTLLIKFADAVEDNKIDANEKIDLAKAARELFSKTVI